MEKQAYCPAEDNPRLVFEIGRITVRYAMLETLLKNLIGVILKVKANQSDALSAHLNLKAKLEMAGSLVHESLSHGSQQEYLLKTLAEAKKASKKRNAFTHQLIGYASDQGEGLYSHQKVARGGSVETKKMKVTLEDAESVASDLGAVNLKLVRIVIGDRPWEKTA